MAEHHTVQTIWLTVSQPASESLFLSVALCLCLFLFAFAFASLSLSPPFHPLQLRSDYGWNIYNSSEESLAIAQNPLKFNYTLRVCVTASSVLICADSTFDSAS